MFNVVRSAANVVNKMKNAYIEECLGDSTIFRWLHAFIIGRKSAELFLHATSCIEKASTQ